MSARCEVCQGSGSNPGSEYLDCLSCEAAVSRALLEKELIIKKQPVHVRDLVWMAHQRAYAMGRAALEAEKSALREELAKAKQDAARYQYIRNQEAFDQAIWDALEGVDSTSDEPLTKEEYLLGLDRACDAAIAAMKVAG